MIVQITMIQHKCQVYKHKKLLKQAKKQRKNYPNNCDKMESQRCITNYIPVNDKSTE